MFGFKLSTHKTKQSKRSLLNKVLCVWGYVTVVVQTRKWTCGGRCPFNLRHSSKNLFEKLILQFPQYNNVIKTRETKFRSQRVSILRDLIKIWRRENARIIRSECMISVSKGNLFRNAFTEDWYSEAHMNSAFLRAPFGETRQRLSIYDLDKFAWDSHIDIISDLFKHNSLF